MFIVFYVVFVSDVAHGYTDNMSEQIDMVEVETEPNESDELLYLCNNANMVDNHSRQEEIISKSKNLTSIQFH